VEETADALFHALNMPPAEQRERMASLRGTVHEFNVYRWAGRMLSDAARLRLRQRVSTRLQRHAGSGTIVPLNRRSRPQAGLAGGDSGFRCLIAGVRFAQPGLRGSQARTQPATAASAALNVALGRITAVTFLRSGK
jgi:hypothetical protein